MFGDKQFHNDDYFESYHTEVMSDMSIQATLSILGAVVIFVLLIACCAQCCCRRSRGQVLTPAPAQVQVQVQSPYPQQQYNAPYPTQVVTTYPVHTGAQVAYPHSAGYPYPSMPTASSNQAPTAAPYPAAPYPTSGYPSAAYPSAAYPPSAPSAPEANVMPPSYEQAVCAKPPGNNPYAAQ